MSELEQVASIILGIAGIAGNIITDFFGEVLKDRPLWDDKLGFIISGLLAGLLLLFFIVCIVWLIHFKKNKEKEGKL